MKIFIHIGLALMAVYLTEAAEKKNIANVFNRLRGQQRTYATTKELCEGIGFSGHNGIVPVCSGKTSHGRLKERMQQTYGGLEVVGGGLAAEYKPSRGYTGLVSGEVYVELEGDIPDPYICNQAKDVVTDVAFKDAGAVTADVTNVQVVKNVYVKAGKAYLSYEVNFFFMDGETPSRPCYFIDACELNVLFKFNNIQHKSVEFQNLVPNRRWRRSTESIGDDECPVFTTSAPEQKSTTPDGCGSDCTTPAPETTRRTTSRTTSGPSACVDPARGVGGNKKTGKFFYGEFPLCLNTTVRKDTCILENDYVKVIDLKQSTSRSGRSPAEFKCSDGYDDEINGAYSAVLDAMHFGTASARMFIEWYNMTALSFKPVLYVHYGSEYENAFWDGRSLTFGDGRMYFHPLVNQDVVAHELAHGVTSRLSKLIYDDQSGGINEAFSDITGEATEMFARRSNDWLTGAEIIKGSGALRYFEDPTKDRRSIKHLDDYHDDVNVHYSSGIVNHAFYQMVKVNLMPIRNAFQCFLRANMLYWGRSTTFEEGACDVMKACYDLGFDHLIVKRSFQKVGVTFSDCSEESFMDVVEGDETYKEVTVSFFKNPLFRVKPLAGSRKVTVTASAPARVITITLYDDIETGSSVKAGKDKVTHSLSSPVYLRLSADVEFDIENVSLDVVYE